MSNDNQSRIQAIKDMMDRVPVGNHEWSKLATELYLLETPPPKDTVAATIAERGKVYGDPYQSHRNIGLAWAALIQQHYGIVLDYPLPASLVAQMMVAFKIQRAARVFHADNYIDLAAYARFAEEFQQKEPEA